MSLAGSVVSGLAGGSGGYEAYERIANGGFVSAGIPWTIPGAGWQISAGAARTIEGAGGADLVQTFTVAPSGVAVALSVLVVSNTSSQQLRVNLTYGGDVVQTILTSAAVGTLTANITASANFDGIQIIVIEDAGVTTIDNVSLIA